MRKISNIAPLWIVSFFVSFLILSSLCSLSLAENSQQRYVATTKTSNEWSEEIRLTNFTTYENNWARYPTIAVSNNVIHVVCEEYWYITPPYSKTELRYICSADLGRTWTNPINFTATDDCYSMFPSIVTEKSNIYVVWQDHRGADREIYFKNSSDSGQTWQNDTALTSNDGKASQWPYIAANDTNLHVIWGDCRDDSPYYSLPELYYKRSLNGGTSWDDGLGNGGQDRRLTFNISESVTTSPRGIAVEGSTIHAIVTQCLSTNERVVGYLKSEDNGMNWTEIQVLSTEGDGYHSYGWDITVNQSNVHVVWIEQKHGGINEIYYRNSTDNGNTWFPEVRLTNTTIDEYDPHIIVNGFWVWVSWWSTGDNCGYYRLSNDNGITWKDPIKLTTQSGTPILAVSEGYVLAVFASDRTGNDEIYYKRYPKFNDPPEINDYYPLTNVTITETQTQLFSVNATDPDNDTLTYQWYLNDSLLVNETNLSYTFIPNGSMSGNYSVKVVISDGEYEVNQIWTVTVINVEQMQETINNLQTQLYQLNESYTKLLTTLTQLSDELTSIWLQLNNSELNSTELQNKIQGLNENFTTLKSQLNLSNQNNTVLQNLINNLNQTLNVSNQQITTLWSLLNQSLANQTQFSNQLAELNNTINSLQKEIDNLKKENEQIVSEREVAEERLMIAVILLIVVSFVCVLIVVSKRKK